MGTMTLADYRTELTFLLKGRDDSAVNDTRIDRIVNQAYSHLCQPEVHRHKEMVTWDNITLVAADYDYDMSSLFTPTVLGVKDVTYYEATSISATATKRDLHPKSVNWFNKKTIPSGGSPSAYALDGELLLISPVPSAAEAGNLVRVTYWQEPTVLSGDSDTTVLGNAVAPRVRHRPQGVVRPHSPRIRLHD
jgi:hypothetical protein